MQLLEPRPTPPSIMQASLYVRVCEPLADGAEERVIYNVVNRFACMLTLWQNSKIMWSIEFNYLYPPSQIAITPLL
jgi:hypothetical protein